MTRRMIPPAARCLLLIVSACVILASQLAAQVVTVKSVDQTGHGFLLSHEGTCYVILPAHVAGTARRVTVLTAAPVANAEATIEHPFWDGLDLAIGPVRGAAAETCDETLDSLAGKATLVDGAQLELVRLRPSGEVDRIRMRYTSSAFLTLEAEMLEAGEEFFQGTSGAFLFQDGVPVGMVTQTPAPTRGTFIRMEHIKANVELWLLRRSGTFARQAASADAAGPGLPFEVVSASLPPTAPENAPSNLNGDGAYIFDPTAQNRIVLRLDGAESPALRSIAVRSDPDAGYALPRDVRIDVSAREDGSALRSFTTGAMAPDGVMEARRSPTFARWVVITVLTAWSDGPVGIEDVQLE